MNIAFSPRVSSRVIQISSVPGRRLITLIIFWIPFYFYFLFIVFTPTLIVLSSDFFGKKKKSGRYTHNTAVAGKKRVQNLLDILDVVSIISSTIEDIRVPFVYECDFSYRDSNASEDDPHSHECTILPCPGAVHQRRKERCFDGQMKLPNSTRRTTANAECISVSETGNQEMQAVVRQYR